MDGCNRITISRLSFIRYIAPVWIDFEPIGYKFRQHVHQMLNGLVPDPRGDSDSDGGSGSSSDSAGDEASDRVGGDNDIEYSSLDPTQWKVWSFVVCTCTYYNIIIIII